MYAIGLTLCPATIAPGQSLSAPCPTGAFSIVGFSMPAAWAAAPITFQASPDGGITWQELVDGAGNAIAIQAAANQFVMPLTAPSYDWRGVNMIQLRSGTLAAPVAQPVGAIVNVVTRNELT